MHVPYEHHYPGYVRPYTTATALSAGWVWEIPLQNKRSLGYVHSSAFLSDDDAEKEIRAFEGKHSESLDSRIVRFRVGHREKAWVRNCVAIGLSGGFIEPLESTGLYLSDLATVMLSEHFRITMTWNHWRFVSTASWRIVSMRSSISSICITALRDEPILNSGVRFRGRNE